MTKRSEISKARAAANGCDCDVMDRIEERTVKVLMADWNKGGLYPAGASAPCPTCGETTWIDMPPRPSKRAPVEVLDA